MSTTQDAQLPPERIGNGRKASLADCIAEFENYAKGNPHPDRAHAYQHCADFLREHCDAAEGYYTHADRAFSPLAPAVEGGEAVEWLKKVYAMGVSERSVVPQQNAGEMLVRLDELGFGKQEGRRGNTLIAMVMDCADEVERLRAATPSRPAPEDVFNRAAEICAEMAREAATKAARERSRAERDNDEFAVGTAAQYNAQVDALREAQKRIEDARFDAHVAPDTAQLTRE